MHRFYKMIVLVILAASGSPLISQSTLLNPISTLVDKSKAGNKLPAIIDNAGNTRGAFAPLICRPLDRRIDEGPGWGDSTLSYWIQS